MIVRACFEGKVSVPGMNCLALLLISLLLADIRRAEKIIIS